MNFKHQVWLRKVELVEAAIEENAFPVQHRPHRAVTDEHALFDGVKKWDAGQVLYFTAKCWYFNVFRSIRRYEFETRSRQTEATPETVDSAKRW